MTIRALLWWNSIYSVDPPKSNDSGGCNINSKEFPIESRVEPLNYPSKSILKNGELSEFNEAALVLWSTPPHVKLREFTSPPWLKWHSRLLTGGIWIDFPTVPRDSFSSVTHCVLLCKYELYILITSSYGNIPSVCVCFFKPNCEIMKANKHWLELNKQKN